MKLFQRRPRYADIVATVALVLAMGGAAYAAATVAPPNSVDTAAIQDKAVTKPKIHNNAVDGARVVDGSLTGADLADGSVGNFDLGAGVVTHSKLGPSSIDGSNVAADSLSLSDIVGADRTGAISFSVGANSCGTLTLGVSGAQVGQVVLMSFTGTVALPPAVMFGVPRVVSAGSITLRDCNVSSTSFSVSGLGIRVVTFG